MSDVVQKLWGFCHTLRHDGIDYGDYIEQITYLLFLKMADERGIDLSRIAEAEPRTDCSWPASRHESGPALTDHYADVLRALGQPAGPARRHLRGRRPRFNNPANLKRLIDLIDETEWTALDVDIKAAAFEGLLEKAASEGKKGAGQYFTPRLLIQSIVRCMKPDPRAAAGLHHLRSGLRHRRLPGRRPTSGSWRKPRGRRSADARLAQAGAARHLLRPGAGRRARGGWR